MTAEALQFGGIHGFPRAILKAKTRKHTVAKQKEKAFLGSRVLPADGALHRLFLAPQKLRSKLRRGRCFSNGRQSGTRNFDNKNPRFAGWRS